MLPPTVLFVPLVFSSCSDSDTVGPGTLTRTEEVDLDLEEQDFENFIAATKSLRKLGAHSDAALDATYAEVPERNKALVRKYREQLENTHE